jgi:hypothetical protein
LTKLDLKITQKLSEKQQIRKTGAFSEKEWNTEHTWDKWYTYSENVSITRLYKER